MSVPIPTCIPCKRVPGKRRPVRIIPNFADNEKLASLSLSNKLRHAFSNDILIFVVRRAIYQPVTLCYGGPGHPNYISRTRPLFCSHENLSG